jgi:hypothetical protein
MDWIAFYNHRRLYSSLGYFGPMQFKKSWYEAQREKPRDHRTERHTKRWQDRMRGRARDQ